MIKRILSRFRKPKKSQSLNFHPFSSLPLGREEVKLVLDVGAYEGYYTQRALSFYPNAKVISFEPSVENIAGFKRNLHNCLGDNSRVALHEVAVSDTSGLADFNLTSFGPAHSLEKQAKEHQRQNPNVYEVGTSQVRTISLDESIPEDAVVDILKIDVEGHELNVLRGAMSLLERSRFLIVEISLARDETDKSQKVFQIFDLVSTCGFCLYSIIDVYLFDRPEDHLGMAQFDAIFRNTRL
jgi:FkbM family methyltransferase